MATKRRLPFGYQMEFGEIVFQQAEAEIVRWVYKAYTDGASFTELTDLLREQKVPYDGDRPWNKNMVARILEDHRYLGDGGYPQIILAELFEKASKRRKNKVSSKQKTPAEKELRRLCGERPPAYVGIQVHNILNRLSQHPEEITCERVKKACPPEAKQLRMVLEALLHDPPVDEGQAKALAFQIAKIQLDAIGSEEYETERLRRLFQRWEPKEELDAELLHESVRKITYNRDYVTVLLKNNQTFEGGRVNDRN